jgi:hypothetical protein
MPHSKLSKVWDFLRSPSAAMAGMTGGTDSSGPDAVC